MAYSGTRAFNLSVDEIIEEAFERCYDLKTAKRSLNLMFSEWANRGLNLWTIDYYFKTLTAGTNNFALDQKVMDIVDATITTTAYDATDSTPVNRGLEGGSTTTDVAITKISRTEYMNLSRKNQTGSAGTARPTQFSVINGASTYSDITDETTATSGSPGAATGRGSGDSDNRGSGSEPVCVSEAAGGSAHDDADGSGCGGPASPSGAGVDAAALLHMQEFRPRSARTMQQCWRAADMVVERSQSRISDQRRRTTERGGRI